MWRKIGFSVAGLGTAGILLGIAGTRSFTVRRTNIPVLPDGCKPIKILHISDIHLLPSQKLKQCFLSALADLKPDFIVNTGDNISSAKSVKPLLKSLERLLKIPGVFVFGSNDYYAPHLRNPLGYLFRDYTQTAELKKEPDLPWVELRDTFISSGWVDLTHRRKILSVKGIDIEFRGTDDAHHGFDRYETVSGKPINCDIAIGVTHAPYLRILDAMTSDNLDLILAGHTHGGQVCLPFKGAITTNCDLEPARAKKLSVHITNEQRSYLHVSAGLGTSPFAPYRFFCRPEANLLTLVPRVTK